MKAKGVVINQCDCGQSYTRNNKHQHMNSKKHKNWADQQPVPNQALVP